VNPLTFFETFFSRTSYLSSVRSQSHVPGHTSWQQKCISAGEV
jgi:hypothetical protein